MSDNEINTAAGDLAIPGGRPAPEPPPPLSYAAAESRKQEILASAELRQKIFDGDIDATVEWRRLTEALSRPSETSADPRTEAAEHLQQSAGYTLAPEIVQEIVENRPVSPLERRFAQAKWDELKRDADWFQRYQRGEQKALKEKALVDSILSRPVKDPQSQ
jgi:hypothetical protein